MHWILILILCGVICYLAALGVLVVAENSVPAPRESCTALIVLGAQVKDTGEPSVQLTFRMQAALDWQREHRDVTVICCGGQGADEPVAEGDCMREWFIQNGVEPQRVFSENESTDTRENIRLAKRFLQDENAPVIIVTSDYHLPRALRIARDCGLNADGLKAVTLPSFWLKNHLREVLAWGKYILLKIF